MIFSEPLTAESFGIELGVLCIVMSRSAKREDWIASFKVKATMTVPFLCVPVVQCAPP